MAAKIGEKTYKGRKFLSKNPSILNGFQRSQNLGF